MAGVAGRMSACAGPATSSSRRSRRNAKAVKQGWSGHPVDETRPKAASATG